MSGAVVVYRGRETTINLDLNMDCTGDTITSEIRSEPNRDSNLIATWDVTVVDASTGKYKLILGATASGQVVVDSGYTDVLRVSNSKPLPVFDNPLEVIFKGTVTEAS